MNERYQDMLRAMQMVRAGTREAGQGQAAAHEPGDVAPQEHELVSQQIQHLQMQAHQLQQQQLQQQQGLMPMQNSASRSPGPPYRTDAEPVPGVGRQLDAGQQKAATGWALHDLSPQQQQQQLLMLLQQQQRQQQPRQVSQAEHQLRGSGVNDVAAAVAGLLQSRKEQQVANDHSELTQHTREHQGEAQLEREFHAQQLQQQHERSPLARGVHGVVSDFVDLTGDDDANGTNAAASSSAGAKRRLPASFLQGGEAVKRPAPRQVPEPQLPLSDGSGGAQRLFMDPTAPLRRRLPPSLAASAASAGVGEGRNNLMLPQPQALRQQQMQPDEDPRLPSAQEQQLMHFLDIARTRLREGTMPAGGSSSEMRPMTTEERAQLEEGMLKLLREIAALQQERRQLLQAMQQHSQQQLQVGTAAGASTLHQGHQGLQGLQGHQGLQGLQGHQQQLGSRSGYGIPSVTTGMSVDRADRYRSQGNGILQSHGSLVTAAGLGGLAGASGSNGAASASALPAASRSLPASISGLRESGQSRVTEHQQALKAVIESLQVSGSEELEPPPKSLQVTVLRHQRMALAWMIRRETGPEPRGGILADDQGLGKTVTTISLIITHTNPEERNEHRAGQQQRQQQGLVEVVELDDDDDDEEEDDDDVEDLAMEDEGEEDVDVCGVRMGALRAEREAACAAGAAEVEGAAAEMLREEGGGGNAVTALAEVAVAPVVQPTPGTATIVAAGSDAVVPHSAVEGGGVAASTADAATTIGDCNPSCVVSCLDDDDEEDNKRYDDDGTPVRPHKIITVTPGGAGGVLGDPGKSSTSTGIGIGIRVGATAVAAASSSILSLPPTAAGSLSQLASSNLAASAATSTAALFASHDQKL
ncbi:hypothetical protein Vafri_11110, partial [Volvox africanus]